MTKHDTFPIYCDGRTYDVPNSWYIVQPQVFVNFVANLLQHYAGKMTVGEVKLRWLCDAMGWKLSKMHSEDSMANAIVLADRITCLFDPVTAVGDSGSASHPTLTPRLCFARQMIPSVKPALRSYSGYTVESSYGSLTVSLTALQFIEAREQLARGSDALPLLAAILYYPGVYDSQGAQRLASEMAALDAVTLTAIQMNFVALVNCLFTLTDFSLLAKFKAKEQSPIATDMTDALYDLSSDGLGSASEVEHINVITYLRIMRKKIIEAVRQMRSMEWDVVRISQETSLPVEVVQKIVGI